MKTVEKPKINNNKTVKEHDLKKESGWNERLFIKDSRSILNQKNKGKNNNNFVHLKIKSRDKKIKHLSNDKDFTNKKQIMISSPVSKNSNKILVRSVTKKKCEIKATKSYNNIIHNKNFLIDINNNSPNFQKILKLWEKLGVTNRYQQLFKKILLSIDNEQKRDNFLIPEFNKLNKINEVILDINSMINEREQIIIDLHTYDNKLNKSDVEINKEEIEKKFKYLKKLSYKICNEIINLRKEIGYDSYLNKYDLNKIYIFQKDYIMKMKNDLDFLLNNQLSNIFQFKKADPFLLNINLGEEEKTSFESNNKLEVDYETLFLIEYLISKLDEFNDKIRPNKLIQNDYLANSMNLSKNLIKPKSLYKTKYNPVKINILETNSNISQNTFSDFNKIKTITANRGLSKQKLVPKKNINKTKTNINIIRENKNNTNELSINNNTKYSTNKEKENFVKNNEDIIYKNNFNKFKKESEKYSLKEDELIIFDQIIEQGIKERNSIDKEFGSDHNKNRKLSKSINNKLIDENINGEFNSKLEKHSHQNALINSKTNGNFNNNSMNINKEKEEIKENKLETSKNKNIINKVEKNKNDVNNNENNTNKINKQSLPSPQKIIINNTTPNNGKKKLNNDIEIEIEPIKKLYSNMQIELFNGKLSTITSLYSGYFTKIPEKLKIGFNIQQDIKKYLIGIYPKIILIKSIKNPNPNLSELLGIATINYEPNNSNINIIGKNTNNNFNKILNIASISCIDEKLFDDVLLNVINFCNEFFYFKFIFLDLYYQNKNNEFLLYKDLETLIKTKAKFKWVNMENDGINRKIKYKYKNTNLTNDDSNNCNILNMKSIFVLGYDESHNYNSLYINNINSLNDFAINYLFTEMIAQKYYKIFDKTNCGNNYLNTFLKSLTFKKINQSCNNFITSQIGESTDIKNFLSNPDNIFNNKEIIKKIDEKVYANIFCSIAFIDINTAFKNIIKKKYNGYVYNIIFNEEINIFSIGSNNIEGNFYLIHTNDDNNFSIIIYPLNENQDLENLKQNIINNDTEMNLSEIFKIIYAEVVQKPKIINKKMYIPSFKINDDKFILQPSVFSEVGIDDDAHEKKYKVNSLNIIEEVSFGIDETLNIQQNIMNLDINFVSDNLDEKSDSILIENDFIFSIVNNDLIYDCQIPAVATFFVKKNDWIKYN